MKAISVWTRTSPASRSTLRCCDAAGRVAPTASAISRARPRSATECAATEADIVAGAQTLLLYLMARTPGAPVTKEIKPAAAIACCARLRAGWSTAE